MWIVLTVRMGMLRLREGTRFARDHECVSWDLNPGSCAVGVIPCVCAQSCLTLCDPCGPPGSSVHGVSQARILEWVALASSGGSSRPRNRTRLSCVSCTDRRLLYLEQIGVGRASQQLEGISGGSEKLTLPGSKSEHLAGFPELEMEVGSRVSGGEDFGSQGQLVGVTWVTQKGCTCNWEGTRFGWKGRWGPHGSGHELQGGPIRVQPPHLCLSFGASQNIPVPLPLPHLSGRFQPLPPLTACAPRP